MRLGKCQLRKKVTDAESIGWDAQRDRERSGWVIHPITIALFQLSVVAEVIPEIEQRIAPAVIRPSRSRCNSGLLWCGQRQRAPVRGVFVNAAGLHEDACQAVRLADGVEVVFGFAASAIGTDEVLQVAADGRFDISIALVLQHETQDRDGNTAVIAIGRDERVERLQLQSEGYIVIAEVDLAEGIRCLESAIAEAWQPVIRCSRAARAFVIRRRDDAFEGLGGGLAISTAGVEAWKKVCSRSKPLAGRLTISQSCRLPRPPNETTPVPMPPSGSPDLAQVVLVIGRYAGKACPIEFCHFFLPFLL